MECYSCLGTIPPLAGCHKGSGLFAKSWLTIAANSIKRESSRDQEQDFGKAFAESKAEVKSHQGYICHDFYDFIELHST